MILKGIIFAKDAHLSLGQRRLSDVIMAAGATPWKKGANPMEEINSPIVDAYADRDGMLRIWCDHCHGWHFHGQGEGHRVAHCIDDDSPYRKTGYVLKPVGDWTPALIRAKQNREGLQGRKPGPSRRRSRSPRAQ